MKRRKGPGNGNSQAPDQPRRSLQGKNMCASLEAKLTVQWLSNDVQAREKYFCRGKLKKEKTPRRKVTAGKWKSDIGKESAVCSMTFYSCASNRFRGKVRSTSSLTSNCRRAYCLAAVVLGFSRRKSLLAWLYRMSYCCSWLRFFPSLSNWLIRRLRGVTSLFRSNRIKSVQESEPSIDCSIEWTRLPTSKANRNSEALTVNNFLYQQNPKASKRRPNMVCREF